MTAMDEAPSAAFYEPWQPQIGQRVRVRLSGECRIPLLNGSNGSSLNLSAGHDSECDGKPGVVRKRDDLSGYDCETKEHLRQYGHTYYVRFDTPYSIADYRFHGDDFAAIELEPLDDEAQP